MSQTPASATWLDLLPATSLLFLLAVFSLQALNAPVQRAAHQVQQAAVQRPLPELGKLPAFALTERSGEAVSEQSLNGKIWVADFIFTSCTAECPLMNLEMQKIQAAFAAQPQVRLVSFTVDPETDTPERLQEYATRFDASPERWWFVTGQRQALHQLAIQGFKLPVQELSDTHHQNPHAHHGQAHVDNQAPSQSAQGPFLHSQKFVLVDTQQQIRGYYDSTDPAAMRQLIEKDIPTLLKTP